RADARTLGATLADGELAPSRSLMRSVASIGLPPRESFVSEPDGLPEVLFAALGHQGDNRTWSVAVDLDAAGRHLAGVDGAALAAGLVDAPRAVGAARSLFGGIWSVDPLAPRTADDPGELLTHLAAPEGDWTSLRCWAPG